VLLAVAAVACGGGSDAPRARPAPTTRSTSSSTTTTTVAPPNGVQITPTVAPTGFAAPGATWIAVTRPDGETQVAAVFRQAGRGPAPVVVFLHGSSGLPKPALGWAPRLAAAGFVVLVGCYLTADPRVSTQVFMPCPGVPDDLHSSDSTSAAAVSTLVDAAGVLPGVRPGPVAEVGISLGANLALSVDDPRVSAIVADSGHRTVAGTTSAPVLLLGMSTDPNVPHDLVVAFEHAQQAAGKPVDAHYYPGTGHVTIFGPPAVSDDATSRIITFLRARTG
jgi:dienelactone hydrolase